MLTSSIRRQERKQKPLMLEQLKHPLLRRSTLIEMKGGKPVLSPSWTNGKELLSSQSESVLRKKV